MTGRIVGLLHPGAMGVFVGATLRAAGHRVLWASAGRSPASRARALEHGLEDAGTLERLCATSELILSVCPPHAAEEVAAAVRAADFRGLFVDANAIAPERARRIGDDLAAAGIPFVDGSLVGGPAWRRGTTWLYLSGDHAPEVAALFADDRIDCVTLDERIGSASALKMCFAAYTKGTTALLAAIQATAEAHGVRDALEAQWSQGGSRFADETNQRLRRVTGKAWRFEGEMAEIADTFEAAGLPDGFHRAAEQIYARLAHFKGAPDPPPIEQVLEALREPGPPARD